MVASTIHSAKAWARHQLLAKGPHGIHSPFVFDLVSKIAIPERNFHAFAAIESQRNRLLEDHQVLEYLDPGAGSRFGRETRTVRQLARHSLQTPQICRFLFQFVEHMKYASALELGTSMGITSAYLAAVGKHMRVVTIEGAPPVAHTAQRVWQNLNLDNITSIVALFDQAIPDVVLTYPSFDLVYIDGHHLKEPTLENFNKLWPLVSSRGCLIVDDIYWSKSMTEAWQLICLNSDATLILDFFRFGMVFKNLDFSREYLRVKLPH